MAILRPGAITRPPITTGRPDVPTPIIPPAVRPMGMPTRTGRRFLRGNGNRGGRL